MWAGFYTLKELWWGRQVRHSPEVKTEQETNLLRPYKQWVPPHWVLKTMRKWEVDQTRVNLATTPDTDLVIELVQILQDRVMSCTTTLIVKVKTHWDETLHEETNTRSECDRVSAYLERQKSPKWRSGVMGSSQNLTQGRGKEKKSKKCPEQKKPLGVWSVSIFLWTVSLDDLKGSVVLTYLRIRQWGSGDHPKVLLNKRTTLVRCHHHLEIEDQSVVSLSLSLSCSFSVSRRKGETNSSLPADLTRCESLNVLLLWVLNKRKNERSKLKLARECKHWRYLCVKRWNTPIWSLKKVLSQFEMLMDPIVLGVSVDNWMTSVMCLVRTIEDLLSSWQESNVDLPTPHWFVRTRVSEGLYVAHTLSPQRLPHPERSCVCVQSHIM